MRAAQIHDGIVSNVILVEPDQLDDFAAIYAPDQLLECPDEVGPGWSYDGENWIAPPLPPDVVT
jgi:hypothetical protein